MKSQKPIRNEFHASKGWLRFTNNTGKSLYVILEPWGVSGEIPSGQTAYVLVKPDTGEAPSILISDDTIQIYLADAVYINGQEVIDLTN